MRIEVESKLLGVKVVVVDSLCRLSARVSDYRYHGCEEGWNKTATGRGNITVVQGVTERSGRVLLWKRVMTYLRTSVSIRTDQERRQRIN